MLSGITHTEYDLRTGYFREWDVTVLEIAETQASTLRRTVLQLEAGGEGSERLTALKSALNAFLADRSQPLGVAK